MNSGTPKCSVPREANRTPATTRAAIATIKILLFFILFKTDEKKDR